MPFEKPDVPAFKHDLKESPYSKVGKGKYPSLGLGDELMEFEGNDNYIVRRATEKFHSEKFDVKDYASRSKIAFNKLRERGINISAQLVIANNKKDTTGKGPDVFVVTDKIDHLPVENLSVEEKREVGEKFRSVLLALVDYYEKAFETRSDFLADLSERGQYVYGTKRGATKAEWYLIDTDPILYDDLDSLANNVVALEEELPDMEKEFSIKFEDVRKRVMALLEKLDEAD